MAVQDIKDSLQQLQQQLEAEPKADKDNQRNEQDRTQLIEAALPVVHLLMAYIGGERSTVVAKELQASFNKLQPGEPPASLASTGKPVPVYNRKGNRIDQPRGPAIGQNPVGAPPTTQDLINQAGQQVAADQNRSR